MAVRSKPVRCAAEGHAEKRENDAKRASALLGARPPLPSPGGLGAPAKEGGGVEGEGAKGEGAKGEEGAGGEAAGSAKAAAEGGGGAEEGGGQEGTALSFARSLPEKMLLGQGMGAPHEAEDLLMVWDFICTFNEVT